MTHVANLIGLAANAIAMFGLLAFVVNYSSVRFERTYLGRALMGGAVATLLLAIAAVVYRVSDQAGISYADQWWTHLAVAFAWMVVGFIYAWMTYELRRTQRENRS